MTQRLTGKAAIVTASTDGIGLAIARRLARDGASVMISSRKQGNVDKAVKQLQQEGLKVKGVVCHVSDKQHRQHMYEQTVKEFGGIDILVSNAAINPYFGRFLDTPEAAWDKVFDVNLKATFLLCKEVVPYMEKRGGGSIVFVSSVGAYKANSMIGAYGISKTAMVAMVQALNQDLAAMNIRINAIAPGLIRTKFSNALLSQEEELKKTIPLGRVGEPEDCGGAVAFLVSDEASYIHGETIVISGGMQARL